MDFSLTLSEPMSSATSPSSPGFGDSEEVPGDCGKPGRAFRGGRRSRYRHVPHREKPPAVVQKRNARERRRVESVNQAFLRLRKHIPDPNRHKRLSKVKTLRTAIGYIEYLRGVLSATFSGPHAPAFPPGGFPNAEMPVEDAASRLAECFHNTASSTAESTSSALLQEMSDNPSLALNSGLQEWIQQQLQGEPAISGFEAHTSAQHFSSLMNSNLEAFPRSSSYQEFCLPQDQNLEQPLNTDGGMNTLPT